MANTVVKMPQLGESVAEGTIGRWLKQPGERVERDEPLVEIQTDKVNAEIPSPVAGILQEILLPEGTTAAVMSDLAVIGDAAPSFTYDASPSGGVVGQREDEPPQVRPIDRHDPSSEVDSAAPPAAADPGQAVGDGAPESAADRAWPAAGLEAQRTGRQVGDAAGGAPERAEPFLPDPAAKRFYTPVVLRMAEEHGLDLATLEGTGAHGRVTRRDVERAIERGSPSPRQLSPDRDRGSDDGAAEPRQPSPGAPEMSAISPTDRPAGAQPAGGSASPAAPPPGTLSPETRVTEGGVALTPMRRAIADHMARARAEIPDAWSLVEVDVTRLDAYRASLQADWQAREGYELTYLPFFVKAVVAGLRAVPELNATLRGDRLIVHRQYHLGIAVSVPGGLVVPVLRGAEQLSVAGIARALRGIIVLARGGRLQPADLQGGTFTVNNPGSLGSVMSQPIVPLGQAGIITMEAVVRRPVVVADDAIAIRAMMNSCLSFDHRVVDGAGALAFLRTVKAELETVQYPLY